MRHRSEVVYSEDELWRLDKAIRIREEAEYSTPWSEIVKEIAFQKPANEGLD